MTVIYVNSRSTRRRRPVGAQTIADICKLLLQLCGAGSYLEFCRGLTAGGVDMRVVFRRREREHFLVLVKNGVTFYLSDYSLEVDVIRSFRRWDSVSYSLPLHSGHARLLVARAWWMRLSGWIEDVPKSRWPDFYEAVRDVEPTVVHEVIRVCFEPVIREQDSKMLSDAAPFWDLGEKRLREILGPAKPFQQIVEAAPVSCDEGPDLASLSEGVQFRLQQTQGLESPDTSATRIPHPSGSEDRHQQVAGQLLRLLEPGDFCQFIWGLNSRGIQLESVPDANGVYSLALAARGVDRCLCDFDVERQFAQAFCKWDGASYTIPLTPAEQAFMVARQCWIQHTSWLDDIPHKFREDFQHVVATIGVDHTTALIDQLLSGRFDYEHNRQVSKVAELCGITANRLCTVLIPKRCQAPMWRGEREWERMYGTR